MKKLLHAKRVQYEHEFRQSLPNANFCYDFASSFLSGFPALNRLRRPRAVFEQTGKKSSGEAFESNARPSGVPDMYFKQNTFLKKFFQPPLPFDGVS